MNQDFTSLPKAFCAVVDWYFSHEGVHVHAALAMTNEDVESDGPVKHFVYVEHCDQQRQLLATLTPVPGVTIVGGRAKVDWHLTLEDLDNPVWMTTPFRTRGCGPQRYTEDEAEQAVKAHARKHHPDCELTFTRTSPGRTVVRLRYVVNCVVQWNRPYGLILDSRMIRGERVFKGDDATYGIDIYG